MAKKKQKKKKSNSLIGWLLLFGTLIGLGYWGYIYLKSPVYQSNKAIPNNAFLVFEANNPKSFWDVLNYDNALWKGLQKSKAIRHLNKKINLLDSLIMNDDAFWDVFEQNKCYISLHNTNDSIQSLFIIGLENAHKTKSVNRFINNFFSDQAQITESTFKNFSFFSVIDKTEKFYYSVPYGIFIASESLPLLQMSLTQLESETGLISQNDFKEIESTCGKKVDANIFISNKQLDFLSNRFSNNAPFSFLKNLNTISLWNGLDLYIKSNSCSLNGYTSISDADFLILFQAQQPVENRGMILLPKETKACLRLGFSDAEQFYDNISKIYSKTTTLNAINQNYKVSLINDFKSFSSEEIYYAWINNEPTLFLHLADIEKATETLLNLSDTKQTYHAGDIVNLNSTEFCNAVFGTDIFTIKPTKWCIFGEYLLLAESSENLSIILNSRINITESEAYQSMVDNIGDHSNCMFYCDFSNSDSFFQKNCSKRLRNLYQKNKEIVTDFHGFCVQFSASSGLFYTNAIVSYRNDVQNLPIEKEIEINYDSAASDSSSTITQSSVDQEITDTKKPDEDQKNANHQKEQQKTTLQGKMIMKPFAVFDHSTNEKKYVVFDDKNNAYLIDNEGSIVWTKVLHDRPNSKVYEIDYYGNGKIQYLFSSKQYLYAIDLRGNWLTGYPKKLPNGAQNPIAVVDPNNKKEYRIVFVDQQNAIQSYTKEAKPQNKWSCTTLPQKIGQAAQLCRKGEENYLIFPMDNGNVLMTNQNGDIRMKIEKTFLNNLHSDFYLNRTNSKGVLLTTDQKGDLIYIPETGSVKKTSFGSFSSKHYFLYNDFNSDESNDFIYLDGKKLTVFDRLQNKLLSYSFPSAPTDKPEIYYIDKQCYISIFVASEKKVYIFSKKGLMTTVSGTTQANIQKMKNGGKIVVIVGNDHQLCFFD